MKHSIHTRRALLSLASLALLCLALGLHTVRSVYRLSRFTTPFSLYLFLLGLAAVCFAAALKMLEELTERVSITDDELSYYVWFRKTMSIRWDEIREVGVGQVYTPKGLRYCVFFASCRLTDEEIDNLDLAASRCIYLHKMTRSNFNMICSHWSGDELMLINNWIRD